MAKDLGSAIPPQAVERGFFGERDTRYDHIPPHERLAYIMAASVSAQGETKLSWTKMIDVRISTQPRHSRTGDDAKDRFIKAFGEATGMQPVVAKEDPPGRHVLYYKDLTEDAVNWVGQNFLDFDVTTFGAVDPEIYQVI